MNDSSQLPTLSVLPVDRLQDSRLLMDHVFTTLWTLIGTDALLRRDGFHKRSGSPIDAVVFTLSLWLWLTGFNRLVCTRQPARDGEGCVV